MRSKKFFAGGPGKISISPLRPPCTPVTPLKRSLREGYGTVRRVCTAPKGATIYGGGAAERKRSLGGNSKTARRLRAVPLSATHFVRVHFPRTRGQLLGGVTASLPCRGRWMRVQRAAVGNKKRSTSEYLDKASNDVPEKYVQDVQRRSASVDNMPQISFECQAVLSYSITGHQ